MVKKEVQAIAVIFIVFVLGLVYVGHQTSVTQKQVNELEETTNTVVESLQEMQETLQIQVNELEELIVECGVTIDNGSGVTAKTVYLTKGATALEALRRVAVVETTYYAGLGEFIDSINGVSNDPETGKYWMWYIWGENETWTLAPVGADSYELKDEDNIKFSYETPSW